MLAQVERVSDAEAAEVTRWVESGVPIYIGATESLPDALRMNAPGLPDALRPVALAVAPLAVQGEVVGLLRVCATSAAGEEQLTAWAPLLEAFATYLSMSLHNARLLRDADARRSAAEELARGRTRAMAGLSHELRTPLHSILGYSELMLDGVAGELGAKALQYVSAIRTSAMHQAELVDDILALARPGRPARLTSTEVLVDEIVRECVDMVVERARANGVRIQIEVPAGLSFMTDRSKLSQILINLLGNAVKFTANGDVSVAAREEDDWAVFEIRDSGCGISASELPHIFEPFWQGSVTERRGGDGAGLGLSLVARLVGVLGGSVSVESEERVGSIFRVVLPAVART
jgi:signal transduction histidine kinase